MQGISYSITFLSYQFITTVLFDSNANWSMEQTQHNPKGGEHLLQLLGGS